MNSQFESDQNSNTEDDKQLKKPDGSGAGSATEDTEAHRNRMGHYPLEPDEDDTEGHRNRHPGI
jgi:hypothetical protein